EASFPKDEYRPYQAQKALLDNPAYRIYALKDVESESIKAFVAVWIFDDFAFIEHFAVNPKYRNGGIGSRILRELVDLLAMPICLEVECPDDELASRRIAFYERNNFRLNKYPYTQPPIAEGRNAIAMFIMTSEKQISEDRFETIKARIYKNVYQCQ
ncbi:MAG: GNAT family N-acetyltransferase, partial [Clostridia bacterium]|nr:GNAT family N-acetyltransferase [Clostridia bacterium]